MRHSVRSMAPASSFSSDQLRDVLLTHAQREGAPRVSIALPVEASWDRRRRAQLQLRTLLDGVAAEMERHRVPPDTAEAVLRPATDLLDGSAFWAGPGEGLLLLLSPEGPEQSLVQRLPFAPTAYAAVDARYHLRPLWGHLAPDLSYYVLALSAGGSALFCGSRYAIAPVPLAGVPTTLEEVVQYDGRSRSLGYHTRTQSGAGGGATRRAARYFGYEDAGDKAHVKEALVRFFRALDNGVRDVLAREATPAPLLLAGTATLRGLYRKVNRYPHLAEADIEGAVQTGPDRAWDTAALHEQGWAAMRPRGDAARRQALSRFRSDPRRTAANVGSVLLAAADGRIDTLFAPDATEAWGRYDPVRYHVEVHAHRQPGDTELMNAAVLHTLQAGGTVYVGPPDRLPDGAPIAALLRY